jgi:hypothetical protein
VAGTRIEGEGFRGVLRLTWDADHLGHVLAHSQADEPAGVWTGLACPDHDLALGGDVDNATLLKLSPPAGIADLAWEPPAELAAEHGQLYRAAIQAHLAGARQAGDRLWQQAQALWSLAWSANYRALGLLQEVGLTQFAPGKRQRWLVASFEHHLGPHGLPHPHIHNIVIAAPPSGDPVSSLSAATVPFGKLSFLS